MKFIRSYILISLLCLLGFARIDSVKTKTTSNNIMLAENKINHNSEISSTEANVQLAEVMQTTDIETPASPRTFSARENVQPLQRTNTIFNYVSVKISSAQKNFIAQNIPHNTTFQREIKDYYVFNIRHIII